MSRHVQINDLYFNRTRQNNIIANGFSFTDRFQNGILYVTKIRL